MAKPLTPEERDQIKRYWLDGDTVLEIEGKTGRSHTTINQITKGIPRLSTRPQRQFTSTATSTDMFTRAQVPLPQKKTSRAPPSDSYVPSRTGYYFGPNQDQFQLQRMPMDSPVNYNPNQYQQEIQEEERIRQEKHQRDEDQKKEEEERKRQEQHQRDEDQKKEEERKREEQRQQDEAQKKREHEERMAQIKQETEKDAQNWIREREREFEREKQSDSNYEELIRLLQSKHAKSSQTPVKQETTQPSAMTPVPPTEPQQNNTTDLKKIPVKETPTQPSAENKPSTVNTPRTVPQEPQSQDSGSERTDDTFDHLEVQKELSYSETAIVCGSIKLLINGIKFLFDAK